MLTFTGNKTVRCSGILLFASIIIFITSETSARPLPRPITDGDVPVGFPAPEPGEYDDSSGDVSPKKSPATEAVPVESKGPAPDRGDYEDSAHVSADTTGLVASFEQALKFQASRGQAIVTSDLAYQVSKSYLDATLSVVRLNSLKLKLASKKDLQKLAETKHKRGLLRKSDFYVADSEVADTKLQITEVELELEYKIEKLKQLTGIRITGFRQLNNLPYSTLPKIESSEKYLKQALKNNVEYSQLKAKLPDTKHELDLLQDKIASEIHLAIYGAHAAKRKIDHIAMALKGTRMSLSLDMKGHHAGMQTIDQVIYRYEMLDYYNNRHYQSMVDLVMALAELNNIMGSMNKSYLAEIETWMAK